MTLRLHVFAHDRRHPGCRHAVCLITWAKGASGQAVQCLNLMMGAPEEAGLTDLVYL